MNTAWIRDAVRTPIGRNPRLDPAAIDDVILGCANQAGADNRNVARMVVLLARLGIPLGRLALCTMCIGVGQGIALVLERA